MIRSLSEGHTTCVIYAFDHSCITHSAGAWKVHYSSSPFDAWKPYSQEQLFTQGSGPGMLTRAATAALVQLLHSYQAAAQKCVSLRFALWGADALTLCAAGSRMDHSLRFHAIDTSNVGDHIGRGAVVDGCPRCHWWDMHAPALVSSFSQRRALSGHVALLFLLLSAFVMANDAGSMLNPSLRHSWRACCCCVGLLNVLLAVGPRLAAEPCARLYADTMLWSTR